MVANALIVAAITLAVSVFVFRKTLIEILGGKGLVAILYLIALLLILAVFGGCAFLPAESVYKSRHKILLRGQLTEYQARELDFLLDIFSPKVLQSIKSISLNDDFHHYGPKYISGECHFSGDICLKSKYVNDSGTLWHEVAHAYHYELNRLGRNFEKEWLRVAGDVYGKDSPDWFPQNGLLTKYSEKEYMEDIAEWVSEFYQAIADRPTAFSKFYDWPFRPSINSDPRYKAKLELLRKYEFITEDDYRRFIALDIF